MNSCDDGSLQPSEVAARILAEHALLRPILRETRFLADRVAQGDTEARAPLRAFALMLYEKLVAHIELEDRILAPVVRDISGWGPSLHADMMQEHARQQAQLKSDIADLRAGCICEERLAQSIRRLCRVLDAGNGGRGKTVAATLRFARRLPFGRRGSTGDM